MIETRHPERGTNRDASLDSNLERVTFDLEIMERHADALYEVEKNIQESMQKDDREYKDAHFHSVPKPRKHMR